MSEQVKQTTCPHDKSNLVVFANGETYFSCTKCAEYVRLKKGNEKREEEA